MSENRQPENEVHPESESYPGATLADELPDESVQARKGLAGGFVFTAIRSVFMIITQVATVAVVSRVLSKPEAGIVTTALLLTTLSMLLGQVGIRSSIIQRPTLTKAHLSTAFLVCLGTGLLQALIVLVLADPLAKYVFDAPECAPAFRLVSICFCANALASVGLSKLQRDLKMRKVATIELTASICYMVVTVVALMSGLGTFGALIGVVTPTVVRAVYALALVKIPMPLKFSREAYRDLISVAKGFSASQVLYYLANNADNFLVVRLLGLQAAAVYSRSFLIMARPSWAIVDAINRVIYPAMARSQDDPKELGRLYVKAVTAISLAVMPMAVVFAVLAPDILTVLIGEKWLDATVPLQIVTVSMVFRSLSAVDVSLLQAKGDTKGLIIPRSIYAGGVIVFALIGSRWGLAGVAWGVLLANVLHLLALMPRCFQYIEVSWGHSLASIRGALVIAALTGLGAYFARLLSVQVSGAAAVLLIVGLLGAALLAIPAALLPAAVLGDEAVQVRNSLKRVIKRRGKRKGAST
ncbi:MAG TPA: lipopolysaccharide biosynthesis protein [Fimbriimonas sp.]|nr:lipopolysaccharide biosynthesis protein [Fimbriimonas sp.]